MVSPFCSTNSSLERFDNWSRLRWLIILRRRVLRPKKKYAMMPTAGRNVSTSTHAMVLDGCLLSMSTEIIDDTAMAVYASNTAQCMYIMWLVDCGVCVWRGGGMRLS